MWFIVSHWGHLTGVVLLIILLGPRGHRVMENNENEDYAHSRRTRPPIEDKRDWASCCRLLEIYEVQWPIRGEMNTVHQHWGQFRGCFSLELKKVQLEMSSGKNEHFLYWAQIVSRDVFKSSFSVLKHEQPTSPSFHESQLVVRTGSCRCYLSTLTSCRPTLTCTAGFMSPWPRATSFPTRLQASADTV